MRESKNIKYLLLAIFVVPFIVFAESATTTEVKTEQIEYVERVVLQAPTELENNLSAEEVYKLEKTKDYTKEFIYLNSATSSTQIATEKVFKLFNDESFLVTPEREAELLDLMEDNISTSTAISRTTPFELNSLVKTKNKKTAVRFSPKVKKVKELAKTKNKSDLILVKSKNKSAKSSQDKKSLQDQVKLINKKLKEEKEKLVKENFSKEEQKQIDYVEGNYLYLLEEEIFVPSESTTLNNWAQSAIISEYKNIYSTNASPTKQIVVAVIDAGVDYRHADLANNMWSQKYCVDENNNQMSGPCANGYDFVDNDYDPSPTDNASHGTAVAGLIGAVTDNKVGIASLSQNRVKIMSLRVADNGVIELENIIRAIYFATNNGASVISMSLSGPTYSQAFYEALQYAESKGVKVVVSAGNMGQNLDTNPAYPASYNLANIFTVASLDENGAISSFSNYSNSVVDVIAPGRNVLSTNPGNTYASFSGTSFSAPIFSSLVIRWLSENKNVDEEIAKLNRNEFLSDKIKDGKTLALSNANAIPVVDTEFVNKPRIQNINGIYLDTQAKGGAVVASTTSLLNAWTDTSVGMPYQISPGTSDVNSAPTISGTAMTFYWQSAANASIYGFYLTNQTTGVSYVFADNIGFATSYYVTGLTPGHTYRWNTSARRNTASSYNIPPVYYFKVPGGSTAPNTPSGLSFGSTASPGPLVNANSQFVSWNSDSNVSYYVLTNCITTGGCQTTNIYSTSYSLPTSVKGYYYYFYLKACNTAGQCSGNTSSYYYNTVVPNTYPGNTIISGVSSTNINISNQFGMTANDSDNDQIKYQMDWGDGIIAATNLMNQGTTGYLSKAYSAGGTKCLKAQAIDSKNQYGPQSTCFNLNVIAPTPVVPSVPTNITPSYPSSPGQQINDGPHNISWSGTGATYYSVVWRNLTDNLTYEQTTASNFLSIGGLVKGKNYMWDVAACNTNGCSARSTNNYFYLSAGNSMPNTPQLTATKVSALVGEEVTFNFFSADADGDTLRYELVFADTIPEIYQTNFVTQGVTQSKAYTYQAAGNHCAKARAVDSKGSYSPYSACTYINVTGQPQKPDLYIEQMTIQNAVYTNGQNVPVSFVVKNLGGVDVAAGYKIGVYIKSVSAENKIGEYVGAAAIAKLASKSDTVYVTLPTDKAMYYGSGNYNIFLVADFENTLVEVNEGNNSFAAPVTVNLVGTTVDTNEPNIYFDAIGDQEVGSKVSIYINSLNIPVGATLSLEAEGGTQLAHNTVTVTSVNFLQLNASGIKTLLESVFNTPSENARLKITHQGTKTFYSNYFKVKTKSGVTATTTEKTFSYILKDNFNNKISGVTVTACPVASAISAKGYGFEYCKNFSKVSKIADANGVVSFKLSEIKKLSSDVKATHFEVVINTATDTKYVTTWAQNNLTVNSLEDIKVIKGVDLNHTPIILVPGIMGSTMKNDLMVVPYLSGTNLRGKLKIADAVGDIGGDGAGSLGWEELRKELESYGYVRGKTLFDCPYDWRYSVEKAAFEYLSYCVAEAKLASGKNKVDIIAHSMGGLVTRAYIQQNDEGKNATNTNKIFFVGTPHLGATEAYPAWEGGDLTDTVRSMVVMRTYEHMTGNTLTTDAKRLLGQNVVSPNSDATLLSYFIANKLSTKDIRQAASTVAKQFYERENILGIKQLLPVYPFLKLENQTNLNKILGSNQNEFLLALNNQTCGDGMCNEGAVNGKFNFQTLAEAKARVGEMRMYHSNFPGKIDNNATTTFTITSLEVTPGPKGIFYQDGVPKNIDRSKSEGIIVSRGDGTVPIISTAIFAQDNNIPVEASIAEIDHAHQMKVLNGQLASRMAGHAKIALAELSLNENVKYNRLNIDVNGFVNVLLQNGNESVGVNSAGETFQTFANLESVNVDEASSNFALTNPNTGNYKITLSGPVSGQVSIYVDFNNPQTSKVTALEFSVYHTADKVETFEFNVNPASDSNEGLVVFNNKVLISPKVMYTTNENGLTKIVMEKENSTTTNPTAYRLYSKNENETNFKYLGKISNSSKMEILTFDAFAGVNSSKVKSYRVVGEYADGSTSAMSNVFKNDDTDNDGLTDAQEVEGKTNLYIADTDQDGLTDGVEVNLTNTNPVAGDSDNNGTDDFAESKLKYDFLEKSTTTKKTTLSLDLIGELNEVVATSTLVTLPEFTTSTTTIMVPTIVKSTTTKEVEMWVDKLVDVEKLIEVATVTKKELIEEIVSTSTKIIELINSTTSIWRTSVSTSTITTMMPEFIVATATVDRYLVSTSTVNTFATITVATTTTVKVPTYITKLFGQKETTKTGALWDEFKSTAAVPTLVVTSNTTNISTLRPFVGYQNHNKYSQRIQLTNLVVGTTTTINLGLAASVNNRAFYVKAVGGTVQSLTPTTFTVPNSNVLQTIKYVNMLPTVRSITFIPKTESVTIEIGTDQVVNNYFYLDYLEIKYLPQDSFKDVITTTNVHLSVPTTTVATTTTLLPISYPVNYAVLQPTTYIYSTSTFKLVDVAKELKQIVSTTSKSVAEIATGTKSQVLNFSTTSTEPLNFTVFQPYYFTRVMGKLDHSTNINGSYEFVSSSTIPTVSISSSTTPDVRQIREFVGTKNKIKYAQRFEFKNLNTNNIVNFEVIASQIFGDGEFELATTTGNVVFLDNNQKFTLGQMSSMTMTDGSIQKYKTFRLKPTTSNLTLELRKISTTSEAQIYPDFYNVTFSTISDVRPFEIATPTEILENIKVEISTSTKAESVRNVATVTKIIEVVSTSTVNIIVKEIKKVLEKVWIEEVVENTFQVPTEVASSSVIYVDKLVTSTTTKQIAEKIEIGSVYKDKGAKAFDKLEGDLSNKISTTTNLDTTKLGLYEVIYSVKNALGELIQKVRQVEVVEAVETIILSDNFNRANNSVIGGGWSDSSDEKEILNIVNNVLNAKWVNLPWGNYHSIFKPITKQNDLTISYNWKVASGATVDGHLPYVGLRAGNSNTFADSYGVSLVYIPQNNTIDIIVYDKGSLKLHSKAVITTPKKDILYNVEIKVSKENWIEFRMWEVGSKRPEVAMTKFDNAGTNYIPEANGSNLIIMFTHGSTANNSVNVEIDDFKILDNSVIKLQSIIENIEEKTLEIINMNDNEPSSFFEANIEESDIN